MLQEAGLGGRTANSRKKSLQNKLKWWDQKRLHYYASTGWKIGKIVSRLERNPSNVDHPCQGQWIFKKMWMTKENWWHLTLKMIFSVSLLLALPVGASKEPEKDFDNLSLWVILRSRFSWSVCYKSLGDFLESANSDFHKQTSYFIWPGPDRKYKDIFFSNIRFSLAALEDWNVSGWESIKLLPQVFTVLVEEVTQYSIIIIYIFCANMYLFGRGQSFAGSYM